MRVFPRRWECSKLLDSCRAEKAVLRLSVVNPDRRHTTAAEMGYPITKQWDGIEVAPVVGHGGATEPSVNPAQKGSPCKIDTRGLADQFFGYP